LKVRPRLDLQHRRGFVEFRQTHPMGEFHEPKKTTLAQGSEDVMVADTMGG
jgi:hypothetical protein